MSDRWFGRAPPTLRMKSRRSVVSHVTMPAASDAKQKIVIIAQHERTTRIGHARSTKQRRDNDDGVELREQAARQVNQIKHKRDPKIQSVNTITAPFHA